MNGKLKSRIFLFFICCLSFTDVRSQINGCTDINALNYNINAINNDGSCTYPSTNATLINIKFLDSNLREVSGMFFLNNKLYVHNDGGNSNSIFQIDSGTAQIVKEFKIKDAVNYDWEAITVKNNKIFIADFGNNLGNRTDLKYLVVPIANQQPDTIVIDSISYSYNDQTSFVSSSNNNYDAEATVYFGDSLYIFSKNWINSKTNLYSLSPDSSKAILQDSFNVNGLITDAALSSNNKIIALIGYESTFTKSFLWLLWDFKGADFFSGNKRRIELGAAGQIEAVTFIDDYKIQVASEAFSVVSGYTGQLDIKEYILPNTTSSIPKKESAIDYLIENGFIKLRNIGTNATLQLNNLNGQKVKSKKGNMLNIQDLPHGIYILMIHNESEIKAVKISL